MVTSLEAEIALHQASQVDSILKPQTGRLATTIFCIFRLPFSIPIATMHKN
jgi:hypothetical protein